jgi:hypothetical protein
MFSRPIAAMASARMPARRIGRVPIADRPTSPVAARHLQIEPAGFVDLDLARNIFSQRSAAICGRDGIAISAFS